MKKKRKSHINNSLSRIFTPDELKYIKLLNEICINMPVIEYKFMSQDNFAKINKNEDRNYVYWLEMLERCHMVASITILRMKRWIDGIEICLQNNNHLAFCACLRGLIESSADSWFTLRTAPGSISEIYYPIKLALKSKLNTILLIEKLEDTLIHFTHARKLSSEEINISPDSHKTKQIREYISSLQNETISNLYSELCQYTHPAAMSVLNFLIMKEDGNLLLNKFDDTEKFKIDRLINEYYSKITDLLQIPINTTLLLFKIINFLPIDELKLKYFDNINLNKIPAWSEILNNIENSKMKYESLS